MIFTAGHSTLVQEAFVDLLATGPVDLLWDIRSHPMSRWEWFRRRRMEDWLPRAGIEYRWVPALGGHRGGRRRNDEAPADGSRHGETPAGGRRRGGAGPGGPRPAAGRQAAGTPGALRLFEPPASGWRERGFADYERHMETADFLETADELIAIGERRDVAILCAEGVWWRCHRSMVADYLVAVGADAVHLQPRRVRHSEVMGDRLERYRPEVLETWRKHNGGRLAFDPPAAAGM